MRFVFAFLTISGRETKIRAMKLRALALLALCLPLCACGESQEEWVVPSFEEASVSDLTLSYDEEYKGYFVGDYRGSLPNITIPATADGDYGVAPIVGINDNAFALRSNLKAVNLGSNIQYLGANAFDQSGVENVCVTGHLVDISPDAFVGVNLKPHKKNHIYYLPGIDCEYKYAIGFEANTDYQTITLEEGCEGVLEGAFDGLRGDITFPSSIRAIADHKGSGKLTYPDEMKLYYLDGSAMTVAQGSNELYNIKKTTFLDGAKGFTGTPFKSMRYLESVSVPVSTRIAQDPEVWNDSHSGAGGGAETVITFEGSIEELKIKEYGLRLANARNLECSNTPKSKPFPFNEGDDLDWLTARYVSITRSSKEVDYHGTQEGWNKIAADRPDKYTYHLYFGENEAKSLQVSLESLYNYAFESSAIEEVTLPEGITSIPYRAFADCPNLKKVTLPSTLTSIGEQAFAGCPSLTSIAFPEALETVGEKAFMDCASLAGVTANEKLSAIEYQAFKNCTSLKSFDFPEECYDVSKYAFEGSGVPYKTEDGLNYYGPTSNPYRICVGPVNDNLSSAKVKEGCEVICSAAFSGCSNLTSLVLPSSLLAIAGQGIYSCPKLTSLTLPENILVIGYLGISDCPSLTIPRLVFNQDCVGMGHLQNVNIQAVEYHGDILSYLDFIHSNYAIPFHLYLNGDEETTEVVIPEGVEQIGYAAFAYCENVVSVSIPSSVKSIDPSAFVNCIRLRGNIKDGVIYLGGPESPYQFAHSLADNIASVTLDENCITIGDGALSMVNSSLSEVKLPSGLKWIGNYAFQGCSKLTSIGIPSQVEYIGSLAFDGTKLTEIEFPASLKDAFGSLYGCSTLKKMTIGSVPDDGLYDLFGNSSEPSNLETVVFADPISKLNSKVFDSSDKFTALSTVVLPTSLQEIACKFPANISVSFAGGASGNEYFSCDSHGILCSKTDILFVPKTVEGEVTIPQGITAIPTGCFSGRNGITKVNLPEGLLTIGYEAFTYCGSIEVAFPSTLKTIDSFAFRQTALQHELVLPEGLQTIGAYAFEGPYPYEKIVLPSSLTYVGAYAFRDVAVVNHLYIGGAFTLPIDGQSVFPAGITGTVHFTGDRSAWPYVYRKLRGRVIYIQQNQVVFG